MAGRRRPAGRRRGGCSLRVVAGTHRGRRIVAPKGTVTRPTSDRVRENAFNLIGPVDGAEVLDLFAGSGAMGIEALSRGACRATFVEADREACRTINANLDALGLHGIVLCQDVRRAVQQERGPYDLILCDPPYDHEPAALGPLLGRLLGADGVLVWETSSRTPPPEVQGLAQRTTRTYGSARLTLFET